MQSVNHLNDLQLQLLKIFSLDLSEDQLIEIKNILAKYFVDKVDGEIAKLNISDKQIKEWENEHMRTPYE